MLSTLLAEANDTLPVFTSNSLNFPGGIGTPGELSLSNVPLDDGTRDSNMLTNKVFCGKLLTTMALLEKAGLGAALTIT